MNETIDYSKFILMAADDYKARGMYNRYGILKDAAAELAALRARIAELERERDAAIDILRRVEFVNTDLFPECPICRFEKPGHAEDCELAAVLRDSK